MDVRGKYIGIQSRMKSASNEIAKFGDYSCLFLCLCSIADEFNHAFHTGGEVDIMRTYLDCKDKGWIGEDFYCINQESILEHLTGFKWKKNVVKKLPDSVPAEMYTVEKWMNPKTGGNHFKRRWGDTLVDSNTVKIGRIVSYYTYTVQMVGGAG